ncbi:unnamed protein product [Calypogeia fissa]
MRFLGFDEWFTIYFLAQQSGLQMALQRLQDYAAILDCMEGDDAFDLQRQFSVARSMGCALTKAAIELL